MSVSEKFYSGSDKSSRSAVTSKSCRTSKSFRSDSADECYICFCSTHFHEQRSFSDFGHFTVCPSYEGFWKQKGFNVVVRNVPLFKPDMPALSLRSVPARFFSTGNTEGCAHCDSIASSGCVSCFLLCPLPVSVHIHPRMRTLVLISSRGASGSGSASRCLSTSSLGQILSSQFEKRVFCARSVGLTSIQTLSLVLHRTGCTPCYILVPDPVFPLCLRCHGDATNSVDLFSVE